MKSEIYWQDRKLRRKVWSVTRCLLCAAFFTLHSSLFISCSESDDDETTNEFANWQQRNEAYFASLEDSLNHGGATWKKIKSFTKDENTAGILTDYIYVKVLEPNTAADTGSPIYTDSVRVAYRGRLIPSVSYPQGLVFDQTYIGDYDIRTLNVSDMQVKDCFVIGFSTALMHMTCGDHWRVFIPYQLAYGTTATDAIPAYSTLIFDIALIDFHKNNEQWFYPWYARMQQGE